MTVALVIIVGWLIVTTTVGVVAGLDRRFGLEEFMVGGRSFGTLLFYTIAAAEIYSAFAFLGLAGWAFGKGLSVTYAMAYIGIAYGLLFFLGPRIQRLGKRAGYVTQPDFFEDRYQSRWLAVTTAVVGVVFIIPYLQLQLLGAGIIVQIASGGALSRETAIVFAVIALAVFVTFSGLRGIGWTNLLQAVVMVGGMVAVGILVPQHLYGGIDGAFAALERLRPEHLQLPDAGGLGLGWYASTVLLSGLGLWAWPHLFAATYSAKSENVIRRNAGILPLYQLAMVPIIVVGFACAAKAAEDPGFAARIEHPDHAMLVALVDFFPPWLAGAVGAGGLAAAVSTSSALILSAANLLARNVVQKGVAPGLADEKTAWIARLLVAPVAIVAAALALAAPDMLVSLLLVGYSGITQFLPAVVFGFFWRRVTLAGVSCGLGSGLLVLLATQLTGWQAPGGVHFGFVALVVNIVVTVGVSLATRAPEPELITRFEGLLAEEDRTETA
ncbi:MAG: sodium:solute symporter family protein [Thermoanaerobaculales bacterium]|jgi:SSS family solute:Na+ symporter|nr:sodium:solute symporter family protein [Thermoanaerobaculales bacterium]